MRNRIFTGFAALLAATALGASAQASNLLVNGDFETGDLSGWTVTDQAGGSGSWYLGANGGGSPLNGFGTPTLGAGGSYNAQTDQGGPGSHSLSQSFNAIAGGSFFLDFSAYASDQSGAGPVGVGLDFGTSPNQHVEVLLNGNLLYTGIFTTDWASYTFDITSYVVTGSNTLTFGEVDNQLFLNAGVDNVSVSGVVPEPATWAMMIMGFGLAGATLRRRRTAAA